jgi:hypothetical protein
MPSVAGGEGSLWRAPRNRRRAGRGFLRSGGAASGADRRHRAHTRLRFGLVPVAGLSGRLRAAARDPRSPRHPVPVLYRRQRLDVHGASDRAGRGGPRSARDRDSQNDRQRHRRYGSHAGVRIDGVVLRLRGARHRRGHPGAARPRHDGGSDGPQRRLADGGDGVCAQPSG